MTRVTRLAALIVDLANDVRYRVRPVELDILRAILGEDLSGIRREFEQTRLGEGHLVLIPKMFETGCARRGYRPDPVVARREHTDGT